MSDSTAQKKGSNKKQKEVPVAATLDENMSSYERELTKKIRNKTKKLGQIAELEQKIKSKSIEATPEQLEKIASKKAVLAEIDEVKSYLDLYKVSQKEEEQKAKELKKQHQKELASTRTAAVRSVANMVTMHTLLESD